MTLLRTLTGPIVIRNAAAPPNHRERERLSLARYAAEIDLLGLVRRHGSPLFVLDPRRVADQLRTLQRELPGVELHYATKALPHPAVIDAVVAAGASFELAGRGEVSLLQQRGVDLSRCLHTHPMTTTADLTAAYVAGVRRFVIDSPGQLERFRGFPPDVSLLIRLSFPNPRSKSDLSAKFGADIGQVAALVRRALALGIRVSGFSFHVGSQSLEPRVFARAIDTTLRLAAALEIEFDTRFDTLDIGGGFAVGYDEPVPDIGRVAATVRRALRNVPGRMRVLAEPGRFVAAPAMTLVSTVIGVNERRDGRWLYLDDGVYGGYSNIPAEDVHALIFAASELVDGATAALRPVTLAGPTCDSVDVIARHLPLPPLRIGSMLVSPMMGAYTAVTATGFNGIRLPRIVVV
ncbi:type III PLP-dependent enzyme [Microbacteriaceae bacterium VKM Ac-2855]|nr:type III PLP-dependent enzyme [Microbacteriaceae bacterium VKM Ac-2855]